MKVTTYCPSNHPSGFTPVLDIQVKAQQNKIIYKFYEKPMSSKKTILDNCSLPANVKHASLTEDSDTMARSC